MYSFTRTLLVCGLSLGALNYSLPAQDAAPGGDPFVKGGTPAKTKNSEPWQNTVTVFEVYVLDKDEALALLDAEPNGAARYRRVTELAKTGKARLDTLTALTTKSGQRAEIVSSDEVRYPVQFSSSALKNGIAAPVAWETRMTGDNLEFDIIVRPDRRTCDYNIIPQKTTFLGFRDIGGMAQDELIAQPIFHTQKITTSIGAFAGEAAYLGTMTPPSPRGIANGGAPSEIWLAFLHAYLPGPTAEEIKPKPAATIPAVNLECLCYSLDRAQALEVLSAAATLTGPWDKLQSLVGEKKAQFEHITALNTKAGQRAVTEEVDEFRYAYEYTPESKRPSQTETTTRTVSSPNPEKGGKEITSREQITVNRTDANSERQPGSISAFEVRNLGITLQVEPVIAKDSVTVDLNFALQSVALLGNLQANGIATRYPAMPLIESRRVTNSAGVLMGKPTFLCTFNPPGADGVNGRKDSGRTWLLFLRAQKGL